MTLFERLIHDGRRLFSSRSLVPLVLIPAIVLEMPESARVENAIGPWANFIIQWGAFVIALSGMLLRCAAVSFAPDGTSSRDTRALRAPSLNETGMYSVLRHPLYTGSALMWLGVATSTRVWWLVVIVALTYALYIERVAAFEEAFLMRSFGERFTRWSSQTPAFVPNWSLWVPSDGVFDWRRLASEHNGLLAIAIAFPLLQLGNVGRGLSMSAWVDRHEDLLVVLAAAAVISCIAIIARRWPVRKAESRTI